MQPRIVKQYIPGMNVIADEFVHRMQYLATQNTKSEMPEDFFNELFKVSLEFLYYIALDNRLGKTKLINRAK